MKTPRRIRVHAAAVVLLISVLVLVGLVWATYSAIALHRVQARALAEESERDRIREALDRVDRSFLRILERENSREFAHYRSWYKPVEAINASPGTLIRSPIHDRPPYVLLHFLASDSGWSSPQVEEWERGVRTIWDFPPGLLDQLATPPIWLETFVQRFDPPDHLVAEFENSFFAKRAQRALTDVGTSESPPSAPESPDDESRVSEFDRRLVRFNRLRERDDPGYQCVPETVAFENLGTGAPAFGSESASPCIDVRLHPMEPVWLDLTLDEEPQLALLRTVEVETDVRIGSPCFLQGALLDWPTIRSNLLTEIQDLFPNARITPVRTLEEMRDEVQDTMLATLPAYVDLGSAAALAAPPLTPGLRAGLTVAWVATFLALAAIAYGTLKYVSLAERRMAFVAAVTHELRTPLTSFQLYTDLLADLKSEDEGRRQQFVEVLRSESKRLARLVENVLTYSRMGDARPALRAKPLAVQHLLESVAAQTEGHCRTAGKQLVLDNRCPDDAKIETDDEFVVQILANLVENACKYSRQADDPRIWLTAATTANGSISFEVDDAGPGIAVQDRRRVFQPFRQGASATSQSATGMGLGLALSRYWAQCLGGQLLLRRSSRNTAHYSRFALILPSTPSVA